MLGKFWQVFRQIFTSSDKSSDSMTVSQKFRDDLINFFPPKQYHLLELGCYRGLTARTLAHHFIQYLGIDIHWRTLVVATINNLFHPNVKFKRFNLYQDDWSKLEFPADVILIDADHRYQSVRQDIDNCRKFYKNAFIVFDDYGLIQPVYQAVNDAINEGQLEKVQEIGAKLGELNCVPTNTLGSEGLICRIVSYS